MIRGRCNAFALCPLWEFRILNILYRNLMQSFRKRYRRIYAAWVVISVLAVLSMIAFLIAPALLYR